jgi:predicted phage-related endonuclease
MAGDPAAILHLWQEKRGEAEGEDLSRVLPVQMGVWTEPLNIHWFEMMSARRVTNRGSALAHPSYPFMTCTLDGQTTTAAGVYAVFEAKHVNAFAKIDEVVQKYMPQLHHNMAVTGLSHAILSVFVGTFTHEIVEVACDDWYLAQLIDREKGLACSRASPR